MLRSRKGFLPATVLLGFLRAGISFDKVIKIGACTTVSARNMDALSDDLASIYERSPLISKEEFAARVQQKVEDMSACVTRRRRPLLVAHELGIDTVVQIAQIDGQTRTVAFVGKLTRVSPTREFSRDGDVGYVANLVVSDATGSVRVVLWNDLAQHVEELQIGQTLKIAGVARDGPYGIEVNAREIEVDESVAKLKWSFLKALRVSLGSLQV